MKKVLFRVSLISLLLVLYIPLASADPATVGIGTSGCGVLDGDGGFVLSDEFQWVATNNARGNGKLTCHAYGVPNNDPDGKAVKWDFDSFDSACHAPGPCLTLRWRIVVSNYGDGTGDATMTCKCPP